MTKAPVEPVLELEDIQGIAVPGFFKPHQTLIGLRYDRAEKATEHFQRAVRALSVSNGAATLADRKAHRKNSNLIASPLVAIGFSYSGLLGLTPGAALFESEAFKIGLVGRSRLLGDPQASDSPGNPTNWVIGAPDVELDALVIVAGDDRESVDAAVEPIEKVFLDAGATTFVQMGDVLPGDLEGHEHFGFDDGVSQPGIRGRASSDPFEFITDRHVSEGEFPAFALYGYPGQTLVWPGEFVFGYPRTSPDPLVPGPPEPFNPAWMRNGSYLVYRRLSQDVGAFWRTMRTEAERVSQLPGFEGLDDMSLASKFVGRWPSGAPLARTPDVDNPDLGSESRANNHFRFDSDTAVLELRDGSDGFASAKADPIGLRCPLAAHIRKVNTRDSPSDTGGASSTYERRILRVGVPYGPPAVDRYADNQPNEPDRGLLFLSIQTSIEEQFEFLQARWINDSARPKAPSGNDMIVGQNEAASAGVRRATLVGGGLQSAVVEAPQQFVTPTGGGYFFVPSLSALRGVLTAKDAGASGFVTKKATPKVTRRRGTRSKLK
jgi:Dyp-type peroxidase family